MTLYWAVLEGRRHIVNAPKFYSHVTQPTAKQQDGSLTELHLINELACERVKQGNPARQPRPAINTATEMPVYKCLIAWGKEVKLMSSFLG